MTNGKGNDDWNGQEDTPNDLPLPTLIAHRAYVSLLADIAAALHAMANTLAEITHELRIARDPIGPVTTARISETFVQIEELGRRGRDGFKGG